MMIKGLGLIAAAAMAGFIGCTATAQEDLTQYPTDVMGSSEMAKLKRPNPEACNRLTASRLDANILRVHNESSRCDAYSKDMYWQYARRESGFTSSVDERNDPINYFRYHGIDTAPYEAALAALGFGQHDVRRRTGGPAFSAQAATSDQAARQAAPSPDATTNVGACGKPYTNEAQRQVQEIYAKYDTCSKMK